MISFANFLDASGATATHDASASPLAPIFARILKTLTVIIAATIVIAVVANEFGVSGGPSIYMAAVIASAALYGVPYGLFASLLSVLLIHSAFGEPRILLLPPNHQDFINALVFVSGAILSGVYADVLRRRQAAIRLILETGGAAEMNEASLARAVEQALQEIGVEPRFRLAAELRDTSIAILMVVCGAVMTASFHYVFGVELGSGIFVAAVIIAAITRGTRAALVAGIVAVLAANYFVRPNPTFELGTLQDSVNLFLFSAIAWWVGQYANTVRHQREVARTMFAASQRLSKVASESALRAELRNALCRLCRSPSVWVLNQAGQPGIGNATDAPLAYAEIEPSLRSDRTFAAGPWRARRLHAEGVDLGCVIWLTGTVSAEDANDINEAILILIGLGASAIVRSRLSSQKAETEMLAQTERLKTALLSSISHDFRTPLSGILGSATSLLEFGDKHSVQRRHELLVNIKNQASRLNRYVENLLSMTRLESGILAIQRRPVSLEPLIYDAWEVLGDMGGSLRILNARIAPNAAVLADPQLLSNVLINLFENAIKFSPAGSTVSVDCRVEADTYVIEVTDVGPGIREEDLPRIFDRFYRASTNAAQGMGLGLYISKQLLEGMGASVAARNRDDGRSGLTISFTLQRAEEDEP